MLSRMSNNRTVYVSNLPLGISETVRVCGPHEDAETTEQQNTPDVAVDITSCYALALCVMQACARCSQLGRPITVSRAGNCMRMAAAAAAAAEVRCQLIGSAVSVLT